MKTWNLPDFVEILLNIPRKLPFSALVTRSTKDIVRPIGQRSAARGALLSNNTSWKTEEKWSECKDYEPTLGTQPTKLPGSPLLRGTNMYHVMVCKFIWRNCLRWNSRIHGHKTTSLLLSWIQHVAMKQVLLKSCYLLGHNKSNRNVQTFTSPQGFSTAASPVGAANSGTFRKQHRSEPILGKGNQRQRRPTAFRKPWRYPLNSHHFEWNCGQ